MAPRCVDAGEWNFPISSITASPAGKLRFHVSRPKGVVRTWVADVHWPLHFDSGDNQSDTAHEPGL